MKAHLMYRDRDFDLENELPEGAGDLIEDLELDVLFDAMAGEDEFLREAARTGLLCGLRDLEAVAYRQEILSDCLENPEEVRALYDSIVRAIEGEKEAPFWGYMGRYPATILSGAVNIMNYYVGVLRSLRDRAEQLRPRFRSQGFTDLCDLLVAELGDEYLASVEHRLAELELRRGVLLSARPGEGVKGTQYTLRKPNRDRRPWVERLLSKREESHTYTVSERDEAASRALSELRDRGLNSVANALAQSVDHIRGFYAMLRSELAFYIGCLNLRERLAAIGEPICLPEATESGRRRRSFSGLYDVCLALAAGRTVVGNDVDADGRRLVIITGANHGGKSTFLRSIGVSQLMLQCGMFVGARSYRADLSSALFTHFKRREDTTMESGKFDEELKRMSRISDALSPNALVLFNESFSATNEREGSEIARQVVRALVESDIAVYFVTHQYDFAKSLHDDPPANTLFLRAERNQDGSRSYKLVEGAPLETSFGRDLYAEVFGDGQESGAASRLRRPLPREPGDQHEDPESHQNIDDVGVDPAVVQSRQQD